jgi:hypothetical protein
MTAVPVEDPLFDLLLRVILVRLLETPIIVQIDLHLAEAEPHHRSMKPMRLLTTERSNVHGAAQTDAVHEALHLGVEM